MRNLVIFGDTHFSERLCKYIEFEKRDHVVAFTQEREFINHKELLGVPVIPLEKLKDELLIDFSIIIGIGYSKMNSLREYVYQLCKKNNYKIASYISTSAIVYSFVENFGEGNLVFPGAIIGPDCKLGLCNIIESGCALSHDVELANFNYISANAAFGGFSKISNNCFIGLNATVRDGISIADKTIIGSASNVLKTVDKKGCVIVGNPARILDNKFSMETKV